MSTGNPMVSSNVSKSSGPGGRQMSLLKRLLGMEPDRPKPRIRVCSECGMPIAEHKDWCSIRRGQIEMQLRAEARRE